MRVKRGLAFLPCAIMLFVCTGGITAQNKDYNSEDTLRANVAYLTDLKLSGRVAGSDGEAAAAKYIYHYLQSVGLMMTSPETGDDFGIVNEFTGDTLRSRNIIGIIPGYDPKRKGEYLLIGAHIDSQVYPGADDNASGCAVLMNLAKTISENKFMFSRSVIIAFFGAGELNMAGSWYFLNRSFSEQDKIVAMIDLNSLGRSGGDTEFQVFAGLQGQSVYESIITAGEQPFAISPKIVEREPFASDYRNFYEKEIPVALFTTGFTKQRGTRHDTPDLLDYFQMMRISEYLYNLSVNLANRDFLRVTENKQDGGDAKTSAVGRIFSQRDVDKRASFMRGDERSFLKNWVYEYLKYPDSAVEQGIDGTVNVEFTVDKSGNVTDVRVQKGVDELLDDEAVRVIKASPKWSPASLRGEKVAVRITVAVEFKLTQEKGKFGIKR
ncbi:MAG: TonB family protein [Candidatus Egerieousia sp.]